MKSRKRNLSTNKKLTTKINPTPTSIPTPLTNKVEELGNITQQTRQQPPHKECREHQQETQKRNLLGTSVCHDSGTTAHAMKPGDDYIQTDIPLDKVFEIPDGKNLYGSTKYFLHHEVREPQEQQM